MATVRKRIRDAARSVTRTAKKVVKKAGKAVKPVTDRLTGTKRRRKASGSKKARSSRKTASRR